MESVGDRLVKTTNTLMCVVLLVFASFIVFRGLTLPSAVCNMAFSVASINFARFHKLSPYFFTFPYTVNNFYWGGGYPQKLLVALHSRFRRSVLKNWRYRYLSTKNIYSELLEPTVMQYGSYTGNITVIRLSGREGSKCVVMLWQFDVF